MVDCNSSDRKEFEDKYRDFIPFVPNGKKKAKLIIDDKEYEFPIIEGVMGPSVIDIRSLYNETGYFTFDPGYFSTASCVSKITYIDGEAGQLLYRGYKIEELAEKSSYVEVCYLLIYGNLPSKEELAKFEETL